MAKRKIILGLCLVLFISCSQEDESVYSCDKQIDAWVKSNIDNVHYMTRSQWKGLSSKVNVAVYRAFTPKQKAAFWDEKFVEVKKMKWSKKELFHIQKAEDFMKSHTGLFRNGKKTPEELDELDTFFYKWQTDAERELGWDKKIVYSLVCTGAEVKDTKGTIIVRKKSLRSSAKLSLAAEAGSEKWGCNCNKACSMACFPTQSPCDDADCEGTDSGCGWFLAETCDGRCDGSSGL